MPGVLNISMEVPLYIYSTSSSLFGFRANIFRSDAPTHDWLIIEYQNSVVFLNCDCNIHIHIILQSVI